MVAPFDLVGGGRGTEQEPGRRAGEHLVRGDRGGIEGDRFRAPAAREGEGDGKRRDERRPEPRLAAQRATASQMYGRVALSVDVVPGAVVEDRQPVVAGAGGVAEALAGARSAGLALSASWCRPMARP